MINRSIVMNKVLILVLALTSMVIRASAQAGGSAQAATDSVAAAKLGAEIGISYLKAKKLRDATTFRRADYARIIADRTINTEQQVSQLMDIIFQRRHKQDSLLTVDEQVRLLKQQEQLRKKQRTVDSLFLLQQQENMRKAGGQLIDGD